MRRNFCEHTLFSPAVISAIIKSAKCKSSIHDQSRDLVENPRAMASELIFAVESFTIDSMITGYHV